MEENENSQRYLFLTNEDILNLPCFQNQELVAIKAPKVSVVEVPDPDQVGSTDRFYDIKVYWNNKWLIHKYAGVRFQALQNDC